MSSSLRHNQKGFALLILLLAVLIVAVLSWYAWPDKEQAPKSNTERTIESYQQAQVQIREIDDLNKKRAEELGE